MIKKPVFVLAIAFCAHSAIGQLYVGGKNINDSANIKIIELHAIDNTVYGGASKSKWYSIEWGQEDEDDQKQLTDSKGKRMALLYPLSVANYIARNGWKLLEVQYYMFRDAPYYKYTFTRKEN